MVHYIYFHVCLDIVHMHTTAQARHHSYLRGALVTAPPPGAAVYEPHRLLHRAEDQRQEFLAEKSAALIGASPGSSRGSTDESRAFLCKERSSLIFRLAQQSMDLIDCCSGPRSRTRDKSSSP